MLGGAGHLPSLSPARPPKAPDPIFQRQNQPVLCLPWLPVMAGLEPHPSQGLALVPQVGCLRQHALGASQVESLPGPPPPQDASACAHGQEGPVAPDTALDCAPAAASTRPSIACPPVYSADSHQAAVRAGLPCAACWKQPRSPASWGWRSSQPWAPPLCEMRNWHPFPREAVRVQQTGVQRISKLVLFQAHGQCVRSCLHLR